MITQFDREPVTRKELLELISFFQSGDKPSSVNTYADLPPASQQTNEKWFVNNTTGIYLINRKYAGVYISNGTTWDLLYKVNLDDINVAKADKTISITGSNGLTGGGDLSMNRAISHGDTSTQANIVNIDGNVIQSANVDDFGHVTSFSSINLDNRYITTSGAYANPSWITSLDANKLTGTISSGVLSGSTLYVGTTAIALNRASSNQALTGLISVQFVGATSGTATLQAPAVAGTTTFTLPSASGTLITDQNYTANDILTKIKTVDGNGSGLDADTLRGFSAGYGNPVFPCIPVIASDGVMEVGRFFDFRSSSNQDVDFTLRLDGGTANRTISFPTVSGTLIGNNDTATVSNNMLAGSIADTKLNTISTAGKVSNSATTATSSNIASSIVSRDANGDFNAGTITATLSGNSTTASTLQTARTINGVSFDGSANITITANTTNALTINSPLTGTSFNGGSAVSIGIQTASATLSGSLSNIDWSIFNNKQNAISLTTNNSSGASTFVGNVLNIPNYTLAGLGGQPQLNGTGFVKANGTTITYDNSNYLIANQNITLSGDVAGSGTTAITTTLANSGVTAGTYTNATITVDSKGRVTVASSPNAGKVNASYLLVGGGGGSGINGGGGGGGGGVLTGQTTLTVGTVYSFTIGGGGAGSTGSIGGSVGGNTIGLGLTVIGGGGGSGRDAGPATRGATGGGGAGTTTTTISRLWSAGSQPIISGQGFAGGAGTTWNIGSDLGINSAGGGGGGSGGIGHSGTTLYAGYGGIGITSDITGSAISYGGGGGGGVTVNGIAGAGSSGGGNGGQSGTAAQAGTNGLGGGGGGAGPGIQTGLSGGSGVAIIRLPTINYTGTVTGSPTVTTVGSDTVIKFTANGSYTA